MKMRREVFPREPQVSVVTHTIYASRTSTATSLPVTEDVPIPVGPIVGGIIGGVLIVFLVVGAWWWWGSRSRSVQAKSGKARRAQDLAKTRTGHGKTQSMETLNTSASHTNSQSSHMSEKSPSPSHPPVLKPSAILAAQQKNHRPVFTHQTPSTTSITSSKYAPARPSPLALNVVNRSPSVMSENPPMVLVTAPPRSSSPEISPQSAALRSLVPLPPKVHVVPPSPPPPMRKLDAPTEERNVRESVQSVQSVQSVASNYSLDSPVGVAYGGDETAREVYINPRDTWNADALDLDRDPFASPAEYASRR